MIAPRPRTIPAPGRGGSTYGLEFGPQDRAIDLIFSHANGFNARTYACLLAPLGQHFRILALDQRGHGRSGLPALATDGRVCWNDLVDDLDAILESLDVKDVVLAGHSMGGTISVQAAARAPQRVRALALLDPVIMPWGMESRPHSIPATENSLVAGALRRRAVFQSHAEVLEVYSGRSAFRSWDPQMLTDYVADGFLPRADGQVELACAPAWEASNFTAHSNDPWSALEALGPKISVLQAEQGSTCRIAGQEDALARWGISLETVPGTSHFLPMERPQRVIEVLGGLCRSVVQADL